MKAPIHQRAEMLHAVIDRAVRSLNTPIDSVEWVDGRFLVRAGRLHLVLDCHYENGLDRDGRPLVGSGFWIARSRDDEGNFPLDQGSEDPPKSPRRPWPWRLFKN